jgi:two-component sensor histidine kinase
MRDLNLTMIESAILLSIIAAGFASYLVRREFAGLERDRQTLERRVQERTAELESSKRRAEAEAARATREQERVELLLRDLNHRVGNNLATISALLGLQINRTPVGPARSAIESARDRVSAIGIAQRRLRLGADLQSVRLDEFFESVLQDVFAAIPRAERFTIQRDFEPVLIGSRDAVTLSVVMNELITNAVKHAFPSGRSGTINVGLRLDAAGVPVMSVSDNGVGMPAEAMQANAGLGATVIERMSQQYGGSVTREPNQPTGTIVRIAMPRLRTQSVTGSELTGA